jgi:hypothetical protein
MGARLPRSAGEWLGLHAGSRRNTVAGRSQRWSRHQAHQSVRDRRSECLCLRRSRGRCGRQHLLRRIQSRRHRAMVERQHRRVARAREAGWECRGRDVRVAGAECAEANRPVHDFVCADAAASLASDADGGRPDGDLRRDTAGGSTPLRRSLPTARFTWSATRISIQATDSSSRSIPI